MVVGAAGLAAGGRSGLVPMSFRTAPVELVASFIALTDVLFALEFAWLLLGELPRPVQLLGGVVLVVGVAMVKLGEGRAADASPEPLT